MPLSQSHRTDSLRRDSKFHAHQVTSNTSPELETAKLPASVGLLQTQLGFVLQQELCTNHPALQDTSNIMSETDNTPMLTSEDASRAFPVLISPLQDRAHAWRPTPVPR